MASAGACSLTGGLPDSGGSLSPRGDPTDAADGPSSASMSMTVGGGLGKAAAVLAAAGAAAGGRKSPPPSWLMFCRLPPCLPDSETEHLARPAPAAVSSMALRSSREPPCWRCGSRRRRRRATVVSKEPRERLQQDPPAHAVRSDRKIGEQQYREIFQAIPLFVPSKRHPPSPSALCDPGLVDVVHQVRIGPRVAPGSWRPPLAWGTHPSCFTHWSATC